MAEVYDAMAVEKSLEDMALLPAVLSSSAFDLSSAEGVACEEDEVAVEEAGAAAAAEAGGVAEDDIFCCVLVNTSQIASRPG